MYPLKTTRLQEMNTTRSIQRHAKAFMRSYKKHLEMLEMAAEEAYELELFRASPEGIVLRNHFKHCATAAAVTAASKISAKAGRSV